MQEIINIDDVYNKIISKWKASNDLELIVGLDNSAAGSVTGSEALMNQGDYLLSLKHNNPKAYSLINEEVKDYLNYCKQHGLIIK